MFEYQQTGFFLAESVYQERGKSGGLDFVPPHRLDATSRDEKILDQAARNKPLVISMLDALKSDPEKLRQS